MPEQRKIANFTTGKVHSYWTFPIELFSGIFPRHKSHNSLACVVGFQRGSWERGELGRFPFDQIFQFEIPGIPYGEWNSIFRLIGLTHLRSSGSKFRVRENMKSKGGLFYHCLLALGLLDDPHVEINDLLGEGDNIRSSRLTFALPLYFPGEFKSHFRTRLSSELFTRVVMLTFSYSSHVYLHYISVICQIED